MPDLSDTPDTSDSGDAPASGVRAGLRDGWPIMLALAPLALVLGAQAAAKGLKPYEVTLMTGLNLAGGSEFAAVDLWRTPVPVVVIVLMTFLINSRHLLMGAALAPYLAHLPRRVVYPALFLMVDENWALAMRDAQRRRRAGRVPAFRLRYYLTLAFMFWTTWYLLATTGAVFGPLLGDLDRWGIRMAFPAIFLVLVRGMWTTRAVARPWLVSLVVAAVTSLVVPGAWYVPAGACAGLLSAWLWAGRG